LSSLDDHKDIAEELLLDWHTVRDLERRYVPEQLRRAGAPRPKVVGIDEISIRKRYIWLGGKDRSEASMGESSNRGGQRRAVHSPVSCPLTAHPQAL
jgi:transposase